MTPPVNGSRPARFSEQRLDELRTVGDEPADKVARALLTAYGFHDDVDETEVMRQAVRAVVSGRESAPDAVTHWFAAGPDLPTWTDDELVATGQRFFCAWPMPIATTLFCGSLVESYAAPHGAAVMMATSELSRTGQVSRRLAETGRMLFDALAVTEPGALTKGEQGYVTVQGVRLLHAVVRQALLNSKADPWDAAHGVPINQEDLLGTLLAFTVTVLDGLEKLGVPVSGREARGYLHAWCVIGALLGIDETLLPLTPEAARDLAATIAERQLGPSEAGTRLTAELLREMRLAMPPGCQRLPGALVWRLVPEVAAMLEVPRPGRVWPAMVGAAGRVARSLPQVPGLQRMARGPGAVLGRSVLQMLIDRALLPGGAPYRADAERLQRAVQGDGNGRTRGAQRARHRRADRRRRRGDTVGVGPHVGPTGKVAREALAHPVKPPIDVHDVREVASEGFPLWEPPEVMVCRNRRITLCYADLSAQLARLIAGDDGVLDANWCTYATWSSRTIGTYLQRIDEAGEPEPGTRDVVALPAAVPGGVGVVAADDDSWMGRLALGAMRRSNAAGLRVLAAANRTVFLDVGLSVAEFLGHFPTRSTAAGDTGEGVWRDFWRTVEHQIEDARLLDPSWLLTPGPAPDDLRLAFRQFFEALRVEDQHLRSQHVLAGNLLLAAYEQRRLDGYVAAAFSPFTHRAMRRLIRDRTGTYAGPSGWIDSLYARALTRRMTLDLPHERLDVDQPMPPPAAAGDRWYELETDADVTLPVLQALITRYELATGPHAYRGARDWSSFDERMRTIGILFRLRQRQRDLFGQPFDEVTTRRLLGWP